jgi:ParB/RepB/Spo0J family partition protein
MIELKVISIEQITFGDRFRDEYGDLDVLAASLKKEGIIQPLAVKADGSENNYILLAGGRRYKACLQAGISEIPVRIYPNTISDIEMRSIELMENVARKDLSWVEATNLNKEIHNLQQQIYGKKESSAPNATGIGLRDTASLLGISVGGLSDDIKLSNAIEVFPSIKEAKTKSDAMKMLKKLNEELVVAEIAKRHKNKLDETPIGQQRNTLMNCYIIKDFFEAIKKVPDNSIDIIEMDPPYGINLAHIKMQDNTKNVTKNYNEIPGDVYVDFLSRVYKECYRVMSENSWILCWFAQDPWFEFVYGSMINAGFKGSRVPAIWNKEGISGQTMQPDTSLANCYESFFYMRKGYPSITRQGRSNVFTFKPVPSLKKIHPTERPVEMIQEILQTFGWEGCRVMSPFLGSGNTLLAASNLGMTAFGFDLSEEYKNSYIIRVNESKPGDYKSYKEE